MKSVKKLLSLILTLAIVFGVMAVIPATTVSAAVGDVWTLNHTQTNWNYYSSSNVKHPTATEFTVSGNQGTGIGYTGVLLSNKRDGVDGAVKSNTTYKIKFNLGVGNSETLDKLFVAIGLGSNTWGSRKVSYNGSKGQLASIATQKEWGQWSKWDIEIIYTTGTISGTQYFILDATMAGATATTYLKNITVTELGNYEIVDEAGNVLDNVIGLPGDDALALVNASAANKDGVEIESVSPATIAADTTQIVVTYKKAEIVEEPKVITFDETYLQNKPNNWTYYAEDSSGLLAIKNGSMTLKDSAVVPNVGTSFGNRAFLAANNYKEYLTPGAGYEVIVKITTFPQYTPLNKLSLDIKFGTGVWKETSGAPIYTYTGAQLEEMVSNNPIASSSGSVMFEIKSYVKVPETGNNNLLVSVYGGDFYVSEVIITPAFEASVVDETGAHIGNVVCMEGDKTADLIPDSFKTDSDCDYTTEPEVIEDILTPIVLKKTLKTNIAQKISFASTEYGGNNDPNGQYYSKDATFKKLILQTNAIKGDKINKGVTFGHRAILLANDRTNSGIEAGETYRVKVSFTSWYYLEKAFGLQVAFGANVWNTVNTLTYEGNDLTQFISSFKDGEGSSSNSYTLTFDVTVPAGANNIIISLYGTGNNEVEYWLSKAYVYSQVEANIATNNEEYFAIAKGFEGDEIGEAVSTDGAVKFVNITDTFTYETANVKCDDLIYSGDINADGAINATDLTDISVYVVDYLFNEDAEEYDINANFGFDANYDGAIDLRDIVRVKKIIVGYYNNTLPQTLQYNDYALAWNYEFNDSTIDSNIIGSASGVNEVDGLNYVTVGDKNCVNVNNGILNMTPKYNYGQMLASHSFSTQNTMNFTYGYFEIRAKISYNDSNLPAIWFKSDGAIDNSGTGVLEYDLLETFGSTTTMKSNVHCWYDDKDYSANETTTNRKYVFASSEEAAKYHTYGFEWYYDEKDKLSKITLYVDGVKQSTLSKNDINGLLNIPGIGIPDFDRPMYMILQNQIITQAYADANADWLTVSGATANDFPMDMCIDYVRLYQSNSNVGNSLTTK